MVKIQAIKLTGLNYNRAVFDGVILLVETDRVPKAPAKANSPADMKIGISPALPLPLG
ncbi:hypothetical protein [Paenibacillus polymyxa]|uniref:hypothetical protein n=1 Tax=Paenibacillus polymyxa TaxID=1406 RepID=UPI001C12BB74|nr:hypothetical protein [Paenibacillus polymyxa]